MATKKTSQKYASMKDIVEKLGNDLVPIHAGEMIDVTVIKKGKNRILVDVAGLNTGFIPEKEFSSDVIDLEPGDKIPAYVIMVENESGDVVLSLKRASKERYWQALKEAFKVQGQVKIRVKQANRGGLIVEYGNIDGFLPVSQLSSDHYPRVGNKKDKILERLKKLVNTTLNVKVITLEPENSKVIFSEKEAGDKALEEKIKNYKPGQKIKATITGVVDFGLFVDLGDMEGLVHISEVSWDKVEDIHKLYKVSDKVDVQVIDIANNRVSLSIKRLQQDPWLDVIKDYEVGQKVKGKVTKITPYGAFVSINDNIIGMFHVSELSSLSEKGTKKLEELLTLGDEYEFVINNIEKESHKIGLTWPETKKEEKKK